MYKVSSDSESLDSNKDENLNDADSHNPRSPHNIYSIRLPIQVPLVNKWYTPKASAWDNIIKSRQRILTHI